MIVVYSACLETGIGKQLFRKLWGGCYSHPTFADNSHLLVCTTMGAWSSANSNYTGIGWWVEPKSHPPSAKQQFYGGLYDTFYLVARKLMLNKTNLGWWHYLTPLLPQVS